ncbi:MAG: phosphatase PAP2 family protein [Cytophagales bacterium]
MFKEIFFKNIFFWGSILYFILASLFAYYLGKEESFLIFNKHYIPELGQFYKYFTHIGDGFFIVGLALLLLFVKYYYSLVVFTTYAIPSLVVQFLKRIVFPDASRPAKYFFWDKPYKLTFTDGVDVAINNSFPSGHTASAFALFFCLSVLVKHTLFRFLFLVMAINLAISRVYLCEHFFTDTLAGAVISFVICIPILFYLENSPFKSKLNGNLLHKNVV